MKIKNLELKLQSILCVGITSLIVVAVSSRINTTSRKVVTNLAGANATIINSDDYHYRQPYLYSYVDNNIEKNAICLVYPTTENNIEFRDARSNEVVLVTSKTGNTYEVSNSTYNSINLFSIMYDIPNSEHGEIEAINSLYTLAEDDYLTVTKPLVLSYEKE